MANEYATPDEYKQEWLSPALSGAQDDAKIDRALTAASRAIDHFCDRHFWQATATARRFDTCDQWTLDIDDLVSVTSVKTDDNRDGVYETTWAVSDYQLLPLNPAAEPEPQPFDQIKAVAGRTFPQPSGYNSRLGLIEITGTWGWPAIPVAVNQACLMVANRIVKRSGSPEGVAGFDEFGVIRISSRDDPDAVRLLNDYWLARKVGV